MKRQSLSYIKKCSVLTFIFNYWERDQNLSPQCLLSDVLTGGGGGVLPITAYRGRLRPIGVPFSDHPDPEVRGGGGGVRSPKIFFGPRASVWPKNKEGPGISRPLRH